MSVSASTSNSRFSGAAGRSSGLPVKSPRRKSSVEQASRSAKKKWDIIDKKVKSKNQNFQISQFLVGKGYPNRVLRLWGGQAPPNVFGKAFQRSPSRPTRAANNFFTLKGHISD